MANKGLKEENTMLEFNLSDISVSVDLAKQNRNVIVTIPLGLNLGDMSMNLPIIYNYQNRNEGNNLFGKGFRFFGYKKIEGSSNYFIVNNPDGSSDNYYFSSETEDEAKYQNPIDLSTLTIYYEEDYNDYEIRDKQNNFVEYYPENLNWAKRICVNGSFDYTYNYSSNYFYVYDKIFNCFYFNVSGNKTTSFTYYEKYFSNNPTAIYSGSISLDDINHEKITGLTITKNNNIVKNYTINYSEQNNTYVMTIIDNITLLRLVITINEASNTITVNEGYQNNLKTTTITYFDYKTKVTDSFNIDSFYYFDLNYLLSQVVDNNYYVRGYTYNNEIKKLMNNTSAIYQKNDSINIFDIKNYVAQAGETYTESIELNSVNISDNDLSNILSLMYYNSTCGYMEYNKTLNGIALDSYGLGLWIKKKSDSGTGSINITFHVGYRIDSIELLDTDISDTNYRFIYLGLTNYESFDNIGFRIDILNDLNIEIGRLEIFKNNLKTKYSYKNQELEKSENGLDSNNLSHNDLNLVDGSFGTSQNSNFYEYDYENRVNKQISPYYIEDDFTYNQINKQTSHKRKDFGVDLWSETYNYNSNYDMIKIIDKYGKETQFDYIGHKVIRTIDQVGNELTYSYDAYGDMNVLYSNPSYPLVITRDSNNRLMTNVRLPANSNYHFNYDLKNRVSQVLFKNIVLETYNYDNYDRLTQLIRGNDTYQIVYNSNNQIYQILLNNNLIYQFFYDNKSRLIYIENEQSDVIKQFDYDEYDNLATLSLLDDYRIDYLYLQNKLVYKNYYFNTTGNINNKLYLENIGLNHSISKNPLSLDNYFCSTENLIGTSFNYGLNLKGKNLNVDVTIVSQDVESPIVIKKNIFSISATGNRSLIAYQGGNYQSDDSKAVGIALWFNITNMISGRYLFSVTNPSFYGGRIYCYIENNKLKIKIKNTSNNEIEIYSTTINLAINTWYYIGLSYEYYLDIFNVAHFKYHINFDGNRNEIDSTSSSYDIGKIANATYYIGYKRDFYLTDFFVGNFTAIAISNGRIITSNDLEVYYKISKEYVIRLDDNDGGINYSSTIDYKKDLLTEFDIIPLHSNVISLKGVRPLKYNYLKNGSFIHNNFNYNNELENSCYNPNDELIYNYGLTDSGTIAFYFYYDKVKNKCYLVDNFNPTTYSRVALIIEGTSLKLEIKRSMSYVAEKYDTGFTVSQNEWHYVMLTYYRESNMFNSIICFDSSTVTNNIEFSVSIGPLYTSIGRAYPLSGMDSYPFDGSIDMFSIKNTTIPQADIQWIRSNLTYYSQIAKYDKYNHLIVKEIKNKTNTLLKTKYDYNKDRIIKETINTYQRAYQYFDNGNIKKITDREFGTHNYTYDELNRIASEDNMNYTYDMEGNIISAGTDSFSYDSNKLLQAVNNDSITYSSTYGFLPGSYKNYSYSYDGKRLKQITKTLNNSSIVIVNTYNEKGLRIKKEVTNNQTSEVTTYNYYYDEEDKLVTETFGNTRYDYLYNGDDLYGFVKNLTERYYYIKDITNNILGIIDSSGTILGKYNYDAYGNIISNTVSIENHIIYKCYYYDNEIEMYYLRSRFYVPKWRRFLTPDSIDYLEYTDLNKVNLYAYCGNNPVMNVDPDGHMTILAALFIGAIVGGLFGAGISGGIAYIQGERGLDLFFDALGGFVMGAATGVAAVLGGAAGLTAIYGAGVVSGYGLSSGAALGISMGLTAIGGMAKYGFDYVASPNSSKFSVGKLVFAGINGAIQGLFTFSIAYSMGKFGVFNKTFGVNMIDYYGKAGVNVINFAVGVMNSNIGSIATKLILSTLPSAVIRFLLESITLNEG